jgi:hypothetical protein
MDPQVDPNDPAYPYIQRLLLEDSNTNDGTSLPYEAEETCVLSSSQTSAQVAHLPLPGDMAACADYVEREARRRLVDEPVSRAQSVVAPPDRVLVISYLSQPCTFGVFVEHRPVAFSGSVLVLCRGNKTILEDNVSVKITRIGDREYYEKAPNRTLRATKADTEKTVQNLVVTKDAHNPDKVNFRFDIVSLPETRALYRFEVYYEPTFVEAGVSVDHLSKASATVISGCKHTQLPPCVIPWLLERTEAALGGLPADRTAVLSTLVGLASLAVQRKDALGVDAMARPLCPAEVATLERMLPASSKIVSVADAMRVAMALRNMVMTACTPSSVAKSGHVGTLAGQYFMAFLWSQGIMFLREARREVFPWLANGQISLSTQFEGEEDGTYVAFWTGHQDRAAEPLNFDVDIFRIVSLDGSRYVEHQTRVFGSARTNESGGELFGILSDARKVLSAHTMRWEAVPEEILASASRARQTRSRNAAKRSKPKGGDSNEEEGDRPPSKKGKATRTASESSDSMISDD